MFNRFSHYLSYGATDQETARELTGEYDGLLVPGTVAAFQAEGTRGFVLTLSDLKRIPYVIDPRFPLFQQRLAAPKKSHEALAELLGDPALVNAASEPVPQDFDSMRCGRIATAWLGFNNGYNAVSSKHFQKYAMRLGEQVTPPQTVSGPTYILVPYAVCDGPADGWWGVSQELWNAHRSQVNPAAASRLVRVVAGTSAQALITLLPHVREARYAIWANALDELDTSPGGLSELLAYRKAIESANRAGHEVFALYGGFFAVLMALFGLRGASHGIGYGEQRDWVELPRSGPPPARYYLPRAHRYVSQDLAEFLWRNARTLAECSCFECGARNPGSLEYQQLMKHSVRCRAAEIQGWSGLAPATAAQRLRADAQDFRQQLSRLYVPPPLARQAQNCFAHLDGWSDVLLAQP